MPDVEASVRAQVVRFNPLSKGVIKPAEGLKEAAANTLIALYINEKASPFNDGPLQVIKIQNLGTVPIKICFNGDVTANAFHAIIAGGVATDDGLGGVLEIDPVGYNITRITAINVATGVRCVVTKVINPNYITRP